MISSISFSNFKEKVKNDENILAIFSTKWCGECKMMLITLEPIMKKHPSFSIFNLDVDKDWLWEDNNKIEEKFSINKVPTILIIKKGKVLKKIEGYKTREEMNNIIEKLEHEKS